MSLRLVALFPRLRRRVATQTSCAHVREAAPSWWWPSSLSRYGSPNFGARFVRIIRLSDVRAVPMRGSRQPGYLLVICVNQREHQLKHRSRGGA